LAAEQTLGVRLMKTHVMRGIASHTLHKLA